MIAILHKNEPFIYTISAGGRFKAKS